jgi:hypothetical protein
MVDIRTSCYAARLAAFSYPQKHWKALIFRGALKCFFKILQRMCFARTPSPKQDLAISIVKLANDSSIDKAGLNLIYFRLFLRSLGDL